MLALRVGVTGARALTPEAITAFRPLVADILDFIKQEILRLAADPRASVYAPGAPALRLLSPLAEGADRLVAEEALKAGFTLFAPLPFPQAEYETDFPLSVVPFRNLLAQAETLELDGAHGALAEESYREVGRFVLRNCDVLIAIWDGEPERGGGGAGEIVQLAANANLPVWWIDAKGVRPPRFVEDRADLRGGAEGETGKARLKSRLKQLILPPQLRGPEISGLFELCAQRLRRFIPQDEQPLVDYLNETPLKKRRFWRAFAWLMDLLAPAVGGASPGLAPACTRAEKFWDRLRDAADGFAMAYGDRYRSSYVWIAALAFFALVAAATALPQPAEPFLSGGEFVALVVILLLVFASIWDRWHEKWISYRLLAELCRKQYVLSSLGRALPNSAVFQIACDSFRTGEPSPDSEAFGFVGAPSKEQENEQPLPRDSWVAWYFSASQRAAPLPLGSYAKLKPAALKLALSLCNEQEDYHKKRGGRYEKANRRIGFARDALYLATLVFGFVKFVFICQDQSRMFDGSDALGAGFSAGAGALVGVKAYSEFSALERQSSNMLRLLEATRAELFRLDAGAPLAGKELGRVMDELTLSMMQDVSGWTQLFRFKTLEAGK